MNSSLYKHYHFYWWCHRRHHMELKKTHLILTALSLIVLASGSIMGPLIQNVWILAGLTWCSVVLKGFLDYRKYESKVSLTRIAYTSYAKCLARITDLNEDELLWTHQAMIDFAPVIPDKIKEQYPGQDVTDHVDGINTSTITLQDINIPCPNTVNATPCPNENPKSGKPQKEEEEVLVFNR